MTEGQPTKPNNPLFEKVVQSKDTKRIVVAGPGTGKTLLFKELLLARSKNTLTLTFINSLVDELALELCGLTEPKTLHAFARSLLHKANGANSIPVSSHLTEIIGLDYEVVTGKTVDYRKIFHLVEDDEEAISFYKKRQKFYEHYCYADLIYDAVTHLSDAKNQKDIPIFDQIFVDEFQDFNELEVRFIELLAQKSPVLLVGDDDQALYDRKHASTKHIRERYSGVVPGYSPFTLDKCGRNTEVIVGAFNDVVSNAISKGFLQDRVDKKFGYLNHPEKDEESKLHPKITYISGYYQSALPFLIERELKKIAAVTKREFSVLVTSPSHFCVKIAEALSSKGFTVNFKAEDDDQSTNLAFDALDTLSKTNNGKNNFGWRLLSPFLMDKQSVDAAVKKSSADTSLAFIDCISNNARSAGKAALATFRKIKEEKDDLKDEALDEFLKLLKLDSMRLARNYLTQKIVKREPTTVWEGLKNFPIRVSTVMRSKGLSADVVFITHFDDRSLLGKDKNVTDRNICDFVVALTRARKKVFLISCAEGRPTFLDWIKPERIETLSAPKK